MDGWMDGCNEMCLLARVSTHTENESIAYSKRSFRKLGEEGTYSCNIIYQREIPPAVAESKTRMLETSRLGWGVYGVMRL